MSELERYEALEDLKNLQRLDQINQLQTIALATSAGMGSKEAHKHIQEITREAQKEANPQKSAGPAPSIPLLEAMNLVDR